MFVEGSHTVAKVLHSVVYVFYEAVHFIIIASDKVELDFEYVTQLIEPHIVVSSIVLNVFRFPVPWNMHSAKYSDLVFYGLQANIARSRSRCARSNTTRKVTFFEVRDNTAEMLSDACCKSYCPRFSVRRKSKRCTTDMSIILLARDSLDLFL